MLVYRYLDKNLFSPPHRLLPLAVFAYVALSFLYHPQSPFQTFALADPDDYMRLNEVINWLGGQGWYDLGHSRLAPGAHTVLHWSRLVDIPLALIVLPLIKIRLFSVETASIVASFVVPLVMLGMLLKLLPALAAPLVGKDRANFSAVLLLFAPMTLFNFTPGRVDHHNWQILIAGFGLLALTHFAREEKNWLWGVLAAIAFACGLWIGTEALPWLMLFVACVALAGAWQGGFLLRNSAIFFGAVLALATVALIPIALPPAEFSSRALSWFSPAYAIFAVLSGAMLLTGWGLGRLTNDASLRVALMCALGFFAAMVFIRLVPGALEGPFADFDGFNSTIALEHITEATPLAAAFRVDFNNHYAWIQLLMAFVRFLFLPLMALLAVVRNIAAAPVRERMTWIFHGVFLAAATLLAFFWQGRVGWFMQLFTLAPLTWFIYAWWDKIAREMKGRTRYWSELGVFLLLGPLPVLLLPAAAAGMSLYPNLIMFPAAHGTEDGCDVAPAAQFIAGPWGYTDRVYTILAGADDGPELLFRTRDNVIAGNFNVPSNKDVFDFFNSHNDKAAQDILKKWHVDLILACRDIAPFYAGFDHAKLGVNAFLRMGPDGKLHLGGNPAHPALLERLVYGPAPDWLKPVELPMAKDYLLFEVKRPSTPKGAAATPGNRTAK